MKPRITVFTLAVDDLERSLRFYREGLGLPTQGIVGTEFEHGAVAFFDLQAGVKLAIWPRKSLSHDTGLPETPPAATEFTLGHNVSSKEEVDAVMKEAAGARARIVREAHDTFWGGYAGYFQDPDGHLWEVVWNPSLEVTEQAIVAAQDGRVVSHGASSPVTVAPEAGGGAPIGAGLAPRPLGCTTGSSQLNPNGRDRLATTMSVDSIRDVPGFSLNASRFSRPALQDHVDRPSSTAPPPPVRDECVMLPAATTTKTTI